MSEEVTAEILTTHILDLARQRKRIDGRGPRRLPKAIRIEPGFVTSADGTALGPHRRHHGPLRRQARARASRTRTPRTPGRLTTNAELIPLSSPMFEPGPPHPRAIEVSRVVDRAIRAAETIDLTKLCVTPGEKCWTCFVDVHVLDHAGNLIDAALARGRSRRSPTPPSPTSASGSRRRTRRSVNQHYPLEVTLRPARRDDRRRPDGRGGAGRPRPPHHRHRRARRRGRDAEGTHRGLLPRRR